MDTNNARRREIAKLFIAKIKNPKIKLPYFVNSNSHVFHLFVVQVEDRQHFMEYLSDHKIGTLIHYPIPPHKQDALPECNHLHFPVSEKIHEQVVSLPMSPILTEKEIDTIISIVNTY